MREAISIYGDKEHITEVNKTYVFFTFPDGSQDRKKSRKQDLQEVLEWVNGELYFYNRMYEEVKQMYESEKEKFDKTRHYYSDEEIHEACLKNRFASIDMGISNKMEFEVFFMWTLNKRRKIVCGYLSSYYIINLCCPLTGGW